MISHNFPKGQKILVTGGGGYLGTVVVEELLNKGYAVKVLDTLYWGLGPLRHLKDKIEIIRNDIRKIDASLLKDVTGVIHQAGLSNDPMAEFNPKANQQINTEGTIRFAKLCKENGVKRFTFSSSASIYNRGIMKRTRLQNETGTVKPKSPYSISKYKAELGLLKLADQDFCPVIFRQGTIYGFSLRMRYDLVVNTMVKTALSEHKIYVFCGGVQWRPLIDVRDTAIAHIKAIEAPKNKVCGQIFNLLYKNYQVIDLANIVKDTVEKLKKYKVEIIIDHTPKKDRSYKIDGEKIIKVLKWKSKISIDRSVKDMVKKIEELGFTDFMHPRYYNIESMKLISEFSELHKKLK